MKRILLVCNLGMSTSMLVQRMEKAAVEKEIEVEITAVPLTTAEKQIDEWDVIMLGPQVRHNMKQLTSIGSKTPIAVIEMIFPFLLFNTKVFFSCKFKSRLIFGVNIKNNNVRIF